jgi:hypothetical protein
MLKSDLVMLAYLLSFVDSFVYVNKILKSILSKHSTLFVKVAFLPLKPSKLKSVTLVFFGTKILLMS